MKSCKLIKLIPTEQEDQIAFIQWFRIKYPKIMIAASANGGYRRLLEAKKLKEMGVSAGFPDLTIPYPKGIYHGLYIEMKKKDRGKLSWPQIDWLNYLRKQGYKAEVAYGLDQAIKITEEYMNL